MAGWVNVLTNKPDDLRLTHRIHMVERESKLSGKWSSNLHTCAVAHVLQINE